MNDQATLSAHVRLVAAVAVAAATTIVASGCGGGGPSPGNRPTNVSSATAASATAPAPSPRRRMQNYLAAMRPVVLGLRIEDARLGAVVRRLRTASAISQRPAIDAIAGVYADLSAAAAQAPRPSSRAPTTPTRPAFKTSATPSPWTPPALRSARRARTPAANYERRSPMHVG